MARPPRLTHFKQLDHNQLFPKLIDFVKDGTQLKVRAVCRQCGGVSCFAVKDGVEYADALTCFTETGWTITQRNEFLCPRCIPTNRPAGRKEPVLSAEAKSPTLEPDPKTVRLICAELETYFSDGIYVSGKSDQTIADYLCLPRKMVEHWREKAFGPLKSPEIAALRSDLTEVKGLLTEIDARLTKVERTKA